MRKVDALKEDIYAYIKDNDLHHMSDKDCVVEQLQKKFINPIEELYYVLEDAIQSTDQYKLYEMDAKYGFGGTLSSIHKTIK
jgi:chromatin remodeling complex protein RSC6